MQVKSKPFVGCKGNKNMKKSALIVAAVVILLGGGVALGAYNNSQKKKLAAEQAEVEKMNAVKTEKEKAEFNMVKILLSEQNASGQSGEATIIEIQGKARVILNLTGKPSEVVQPAHIHFGSCAALGGVKYPLTSLERGASLTNLTMSLADLMKEPFAINVHKSAAEANVYTSCGDSTVAKKNKVADTEKELHALDEKLDKEGQEVDTESIEREKENESEEHRSKETNQEKKPGVYETYSAENIAAATKNGGKAVLFFHATWCPFCKAADADFKARASMIPTGVTILKVDYDTQTELKTKYGVTYQHTFVQIDATGKMITKWSGGELDELIKNVK